MVLFCCQPLSFDLDATCGKRRERELLTTLPPTVSGILLKQITTRAANYDTATWLKPYTGTLLATALWDGMILVRTNDGAFCCANVAVA